MLNQFLAVGTGAALGAWVRWGLSLRFNPMFASLPLGTLAANLIGAYLIGIALAAIVEGNLLSTTSKLFIVTGFLGGLTTFSSFSGEVVTAIMRGQYGWAAAAIIGHVGGSLVATVAGMASWSPLRRVAGI